MHGRRSNCSWGLFIAAFKKTAKLVTFLSTTRAATAKWMAALDSAHQIGLSTCMEDVLMVVGACHHWILKNSEISHVSIYISTTRGAMVKRTAELDSAHQIGLFMSLEDVLIVVGVSSSLDLKTSEIGADIAYIFTTRGAMAKRMAALDSAH